MEVETPRATPNTPSVPSQYWDMPRLSDTDLWEMMSGIYGPRKA